MNFNTFFLDKLSSSRQSLNTTPGKNALSSYLFSDIMKVCENEGRTTQKSRSGYDDSTSDVKEKLPVPVNVIKCNERRIKTLTRFINSFTRDSKEPISTSESRRDMKPVVIKKKQFLLSSRGIEDFLKGVVESTDLNYAVNIKKSSSDDVEHSKEMISIDPTSDSNSKLNPELETDSSETESPEKEVMNIEEILQSILNFIANNKSMSLSFKSDFEKVNINIYALPEDNFETKINLEKLASDFMSTGTNAGGVSVDSANELISEGQGSQLFTNVSVELLKLPSEGAEQLPVGINSDQLNQGVSLKSTGFNLTGYENIYKTEITEIAYKPSLLPFSNGEDVQPSEGKIAIDPSLVSLVNREKSVIPDAKFRLTNDLSTQLSVDVNAAKTIANKTVEKSEEGLSTKILLNQLNGKLVNVEFKKSADDSSSTLREPNAKPVNGDSAQRTILSSEPEDPQNQIAEVSKKSVDTEFKNVGENTGQTNSEFRTKAVGSKNIGDSVVKGEAGDSKNQLTELSGKLLGVDLKKSSGNDEASKSEGSKAFTGEHAKINESAAVSADGKTTDGKDSEKHKSGEGFKNILQVTESVKSSGPEVFKLAPELKNSPEVPKTIKTHEIIPEFTKVLQSGERQSMTFQLTPENLGKVKLIVELVDSKIVSRIEVENEQVKQFIQSNVEQLKQNLQNSGIQLSSVNISLTESEQKYSKAASPRKKMGEKVSKVKEVDEHTRPAQKSLGYNTYEFLA